MEAYLRGRPASPGRFRGNVRLIKKGYGADRAEILPGEIIVIPFITPFHLRIILEAGAIVTDKGGVTSHAATIAREIGIPCVVATGNATARLETGMEILVDGDEGIVYK